MKFRCNLQHIFCKQNLTQTSLNLASNYKIFITTNCTINHLSVNNSVKMTLVVMGNPRQWYSGLKNRFFKAQPCGFFGGFLDKQEKIGKIIQKLSNLKP